MKSTDAETTLKAYIGLSYAHQRLGNSLMADSMKLKADEYAASTGIKPVWEEPNTSAEDKIEEAKETWVVNQHKLTWREAASRPRRTWNYSLKIPQARHNHTTSEPWKSTRLARQRDSQRRHLMTVHSLTINEQPVPDERLMQNLFRVGWGNRILLGLCAVLVALYSSVLLTYAITGES